jgi:hypothetical protein
MNPKAAVRPFTQEISEDALRQFLIDAVPEIKHEVSKMEDVLRELVKTERAKAGLNKEIGTIDLAINSKKSSPDHPDVIGNARVAGRPYDAAGWFSKNKQKLRISLIPPRNRYGKLR